MSHQPRELDPAFSTQRNASSAALRNVTDHTPLSAASFSYGEAIGSQQPEHHGQHLTETGQDVAGTVSGPAYVDSAKGKRKATHGKSPYQWKRSEDGEVLSWYRKLVRLKHYTFIPFQKIAKALEEAGGPETQTTSKLLQTSEDNPGEGRLKAGLGRERREQGVERAAEARRPLVDASVNNYCHPGASATHNVAASGALHIGSDFIDHAYSQHALSNSPIDLRCDTLAPPHAASWVVAEPLDTHGKRPHDGDGAQPDKRRRAVSPRTSAAQIDETRFVHRLAELSGKPRSVIDHVVNRMSGSSVLSYISSTRSASTWSGSRWSQRSSYQQGSHETSLQESQQQPITQSEPSEDVSTAEDPSEADATTLRSLFALSGTWDGTEASLAEQIYRLFQDKNVKATVATAHGVTALHIAVKLGFPTVCGILLWAGADRRAKTSRGEDAYTYARNAQHAASHEKELFNRIAKCRMHVKFGLDEAGTHTSHPPAPASSIKLRELCNQLDPHHGRKAARDGTPRSVEHRASGSARPPAAPLGTIDEASVSDITQSAPSYNDNNLYNPTQSSDLNPSPSDSGFAGSPKPKSGLSIGQRQNPSHPTSAGGHHQPVQQASMNLQDSLVPLHPTVLEHQQVRHTDDDTPSANMGRADDGTHISLYHDPASAQGLSLPDEVDGFSYPDLRQFDNFVPHHENVMDEEGGLEVRRQSSGPVDTFSGPDSLHCTQDVVQDTRYLHESTDRNLSRTPLQAVELHCSPSGTWQQLGQPALAMPGYLQQELNTIADRAYRTPGGRGLNGDGGWARDPLAQPQVSATRDENVAPGPTTFGPTFELSPQPREDRSRIQQLIEYHEDRTLWVSCKHKYPRNYENTVCPHGCPVLSRDGTSDT